MSVTQLVRGKVWKLVYDQFLSEHHGSKFAEETLKDRLRETLKELKTGMSNEEGSDRAVLQADDILTRLRNTNSYATRNILRLRQNILEQAPSGGGNLPTTFSHPSSPGMVPSQVQDANLGLQVPTCGAGTRSPSPSSSQKLPSKAELLAPQSKSMKSIARTMEVRTEGKEALLSLKMDIEMEKKKARKIANLERAKNLGTITDVEFKSEVRAILGLHFEAPLGSIWYI